MPIASSLTPFHANLLGIESSFLTNMEKDLYEPDPDLSGAGKMLVCLLPMKQGIGERRDTSRWLLHKFSDWINQFNLIHLIIFLIELTKGNLEDERRNSIGGFSKGPFVHSQCLPKTVHAISSKGLSLSIVLSKFAHPTPHHTSLQNRASIFCKISNQKKKAHRSNSRGVDRQGAKSSGIRKHLPTRF